MQPPPERKPHGFTLREKTGEKKRKRHNDGIKDPADPNGGDHPISGEKRRKLLQQLQGQFTHRDQSSVKRSGGFYRSFFFYSGESRGAQWVESDADTAEVSGFISHRDRAEEPSHTSGCFKSSFLSRKVNLLKKKKYQLWFVKILSTSDQFFHFYVSSIFTQCEIHFTSVLSF